MGHSRKQERTAIEAVAGSLSATWEEGDDPAHAYLTVAGKRVAVDVTILERRGAGRGVAVRPRLRFDKVATRLLERLHGALDRAVPDGVTVLLTITAPIRVPSQTAASLEDRVRALLGQGSSSRDVQDTIHGNRVRIRFLRTGAARAPRMLGFVHSPDSDPRHLMTMARELLELMGAAAGRRGPRPAGVRWLVVKSAGGASCLEVYRHIHSQLRMAIDYERILMVFGDGRVGLLTGNPARAR